MTRPRLQLWVAVCATSCLSGIVHATQGGTLSQTVLTVTLNGRATEDTVIALQNSKGSIWLSEGTFRALHLLVPRSGAVRQGGHIYRPVNALSGINSRVDPIRGVLVLKVPARDFRSTQFNVHPLKPPEVSRVAPGGFVNYDFSEERAGAGSATQGVLAQVGVFSNRGTVDASFVVRHDGQATQAVLLNAALRKDFLHDLTTLTLGSAVSDPGNYGSAFRFAGIQIGTNFSLRPTLITTPMLSAMGSAIVPSSVDVFVNNSRVASENVPAGPFVINGMPSINGAGNVHLVIRNVLGQDQVISQPFYGADQLLARGLRSWSTSVGALQEDFGYASAAYGPAFFSSTFRAGLTNSITAEAHAESLAHHASTAGAGAALKLGAFGVLAPTFAASKRGNVYGWLSELNFQRESGTLGLDANWEYAAPSYRQVGSSLTGLARMRNQETLEVSIATRHLGSLAVAFAHESYYGANSQRTLSVSDGIRIGDSGYLSLSAGTEVGATDNRYLDLTFTVSLGTRTTLTAGAADNSADLPRGTRGYVSLAKALPVGTGSGWQVSTDSGGSYDAQVSRNWQAARGSIEVADQSGISGQRAELQGSFSYLGGEILASRAIPQSFALVKLPGLNGVPVYVENQLVGKTDSKGEAILTNLLPYQVNHVSVNPTDLPLNAVIGATNVDVVPAYRSAALVSFPVKLERPGIFYLRMSTGKPVPLGASVGLGPRAYQVGMSGMVYVEDLPSSPRGTAKWPTGQCAFRLPRGVKRHGFRNFGKVLCRTVAKGLP
ncbi:MAG: fimbria/pilus outer membrane usher protein [Terriglobia bacterium]|nr:fimbria/pilus outer membrane usher protein [Terriglobia bacterium]